MGVNKVDLSTGETLIDISKDTVTPQTLAKGETAHNKKGELIVGTMVAGEGGTGGGSGIIEVPELPTENIDENAVYKVVVNEESAVYVYRNGAYTKIEDVLLGMGIVEINAHFVDELPSNMLETNTSTGVFHGYIVNPTGIYYTKILGITDVFTAGEVLFSDLGFDRGYTTDITQETQDGVYVQKGKHSEDWFYRENGEWVRITPEQEHKQFTLATPLKTTINPEKNKVFASVIVDVGFKSIGDFIDRNTTIEKITENDLTKTDGQALTYIRERAFSYAKVKSITLPSTVTNVAEDAFEYAKVEEVTFKKKPVGLYNNLFITCANLKTINVSWTYGGLTGAPWGATNATINYNYTGE